MGFHSMPAILKEAKKGRYAVGHFNFFNVETANAISIAAKKMKSPVILAASEGAIEYAGLGNIISIAQNAQKMTHAPIALHLDHGKDIELIEKCIRLGFNSVMYDGSYLDFDKNIRSTKKIVEYAHKRNVAVEGELGQLKGVEDNVSSSEHVYTDPESTKEYVEKTGVDSLAIAIGTSHGAYKFKGATKLRYDILQKIARKVDVPLVLHGASAVPEAIVKKAESFGAELGGARGVSDPALKKAVKLGICKVNTDTDLRIAYVAAIREFLKKNPTAFDPRKINGPAIELMAQIVEERIKVLGSSGKAKKHKITC